LVPGAWPLARALPLLPEHAGSLFGAGPRWASVLTGFISAQSGGPRPIAQVWAIDFGKRYLPVLGCCSFHSTKVLVEAGVSSMLTVGVFVIGIIVDRHPARL